MLPTAELQMSVRTMASLPVELVADLAAMVDPGEQVLKVGPVALVPRVRVAEVRVSGPTPARIWVRSCRPNPHTFSMYTLKAFRS